MRNFLLATTAAAIALTFAGTISAQTDNSALSLGKFVQRQSHGSPPPARENASSSTDQAANPETVELGPVAQQLKELAENRLQQYVPREQDRAGVLTFYRSRNFAPLWAAEGKAQPKAEQAAGFLAKVAADGLDPADYPAPKFDNADPAKLAADELTMTNSVLTFARHASIGRVAFTRVSGAVYFDQKAPDAAEVLSKLADSTDVHATLDAFNPQHPAYKALKAQLAAARSGKVLRDRQQPRSGEGRGRYRPGNEERKQSKRKSKSAKEDAADAKPTTANIDTHHRQSRTLALDAARSRRRLCDGQYPGFHAEGRAERQDRLAD